MKKIIVLVLFMNSILMANKIGYQSIPLITNDSIQISINIDFKHKTHKYKRDRLKKNRLITISKFILPKILFPQNIFIQSNNNNEIIKKAKELLGKRYVWGATGPQQFDCSGFTSYVYKKIGIKIPRVSIKQGKVGKKVRRNKLRKGDLVFFDTSRRRRGYINHVGIYIGNHKFIHASSSKRKVIISSLDKKFYKARFKWGRRLK